MGYTINYHTFSSVFAVPSIIADRYLTDCSGEALKVLLVLLRNAEKQVQPDELSQILKLPLNNVLEAIRFWENEGILKELNTQDYSVQNKSVYQAPVQMSDCPPESTGNKPKPLANAEKKNMTISEIEALSQSDSRISELVEAIQGVMGRLLSRTELENLLSFYTYAGLPPEYILLVCAHCVSIGRSNVRSISKTLNEMIAEGIETYEQAETYIDRWSKRSSNESQVKSAFGIYDRKLTSQEKKFIETWFQSFHFDITLIKLAYERTIDNIGKLSFPYINSILASWHSKGISTTREAAEEASPKNNSVTPVGNGKNGALQSSIDMDELQRFITYGNEK